MVDDVSVDGVGGRLAEDKHADCHHEDSVKDQRVPAAETHNNGGERRVPILNLQPKLSMCALYMFIYYNLPGRSGIMLRDLGFNQTQTYTHTLKYYIYIYIILI